MNLGENAQKQYKWAHWAVISFVSLNTLIFGFSDIWFLLAAFAGVLIMLRDINIRRIIFSSTNVWIYLAFSWVFVIKLISATWAFDSMKAVDNAFNHLHFLLWILILPILIKSKLHPFAAERFLALSFLALLIFYLIVIQFLPYSEQAARFGGGWGSYGMLAHVLVFYLLWIFAALTRPKVKRPFFETVLMWLALGAGLIVLIATQGRAEQIILIIGVFSISMWRIGNSLSFNFIVLLLSLMFILFSIFIYFNGERFLVVKPEVVDYIAGGDARAKVIGTSMGNRMEMYRMAIEAILDRPLMGWGAGLRPDHVPQYSTDPSSPFSYSNFHNLYLQIPLEIGFLGGILTIIIMLKLIRSLILVPAMSGNGEIALLTVILWGVYLIKSILNAGFGYGLVNGVFIFYSAWFWMSSGKINFSK